MLLFAVLFPLLSGLLMLLLPPRSRRIREISVFGVTLATSLSVLYCLFHQGDAVTLLPLTNALSLTLRLDGVGSVFAALAAFLWPLAVVYGFEYMAHEGGENHFFALYTLSLGATLGIAMAGNLVTMYAFYELLTLTTLPLVMHGTSRKAVRAGRMYMIYSMGGAALGFFGVLLLLSQGVNTFASGGAMADYAQAHPMLVQVGFLCTFLGLGVKAAVFPLHAWLPEAAVAPTPVTALLHAAAVVKAGAFAVIRVIYFGFGPAALSGTLAQTLSMALSMITILYGAVMAAREHHLKRRLAWSTVSNLSYILLSACLMTPAGLLGALSHLLFHAVMKVTLFYCAGAILTETGRTRIEEMRGLSGKMPLTAFVYALATLALTGTPLLPGFISKYQIGLALIGAGTWQGMLGLAVLLLAAVLTGVYALYPAFVMCFRAPEAGIEGHDPGLRMSITMAILAVSMALCGLFSNGIISLLSLCV